MIDYDEGDRVVGCQGTSLAGCKFFVNRITFHGGVTWVLLATSPAADPFGMFLARDFERITADSLQFIANFRI